jgi:multidrug efflux pump subunit AcrA (membrane-fusion protein)
MPPPAKVIETEIDKVPVKLRKLKLGERVDRGQLLAMIHPGVAREELDLKGTKLDAALRAQEVTMKYVRQAQAEYDFRRTERKRKRGTAEAVGKAWANISRLREELEIKKATVRQAQSELRVAQKLLKMHEIRSPIAGVVTLFHKNSGEAVKKLEPVVRIQNPDLLRLEGQVEVQSAARLRRRIAEATDMEKEGYRRVQTAQDDARKVAEARRMIERAAKRPEVLVNVGERPNEPVKGRLTYVHKFLDSAVKLVPVHAELTNPGWIIPGSTATVVIPPDPAR